MVALAKSLASICQFSLFLKYKQTQRGVPFEGGRYGGRGVAGILSEGSSVVWKKGVLAHMTILVIKSPPTQNFPVIKSPPKSRS
eukprot:COSAG05_NODE_3150_length_2285_cov_5.059469_1_plen_83_part_10